MYDLTSFLTTISAAAASFVAILGGFIASKLLSISGEREMVEENLYALNNELNFLQSENARLQAELDKDDAEEFILEHIDNLLNNNNLEDFYPENEQVDISFEVLLPYWKQALDLMSELRLVFEKDEELNSDDIPNSIATKYINDSFSYTILKNTIKALIKQSSSSFYSIAIFETPRVVGIWRRDNYNAIDQNNVKIETCKYEIAQLSTKKEMLRLPKGMKSGLCIFGAFSFLCIILPLCFSPFQTDNYKCYLACKIIFIIIFALGLLSTFFYLAYLLKWKKRHKSQDLQSKDKNK